MVISIMQLKLIKFVNNARYSFENYTLSESMLNMNSGQNLLHALSCQPWNTAIQCITNLIRPPAKTAKNLSLQKLQRIC